jgi:hypothetical protein
VANDIGEADENRQGYSAPLKSVDQLFQIDAAGSLFRGMNKKIAILADREIAFPPVRNIVQFGGVRGGPAVGGFTNLGSNGRDFCIQEADLRAKWAPSRRRKISEEKCPQLN